jgi:hypothetical protein
MPIIFIVSTFFYTLSPFPLIFLYFSHVSIHLLLCLLPIPPSPSSLFAWTFPMCQFICCFVYLCSMSFCHGLSYQIASIHSFNFCFFTIVSIVVFFTIIYTIVFFCMFNLAVNVTFFTLLVIFALILIAFIFTLLIGVFGIIAIAFTVVTSTIFG